MLLSSVLGMTSTQSTETTNNILFIMTKKRRKKKKKKRHTVHVLSSTCSLFSRLHRAAPQRHGAGCQVVRAEQREDGEGQSNASLLYLPQQEDEGLVALH